MLHHQEFINSKNNSDIFWWNKEDVNISVLQLEYV